MTGDTPHFDAALLDALLRADGSVHLEPLAAQLNRTTEQLRSDIDALVAAGCVIQRQPHTGVRLLRSGIQTWTDYLLWCDQRDANRTAERRIEVYRSTASTQDLARRVVVAHGLYADGALTVADEQTAGRGRLGRRWIAPPNSCLTFTRALVMPRNAAMHSVDHIMLASAIAVALAVENLSPPEAPMMGIKWPNDIIADGGKLAGILVETFTDGNVRAALIGLGVNVDISPDDLPDDIGPIASLVALGRPIDRLLLLAEITRQLDSLLAQTDVAALAAAWRKRSTLLERRVTIAHDGRQTVGTVVDIDPQAGLILRTDYGQMVHLPAATSTIINV